MENDHLVNTILFMDRRFKELKDKKARFAAIIEMRYKNMLREAKKRSLMPRIWRERGNTREMVKATHELHSRISLVPGAKNHYGKKG